MAKQAKNLHLEDKVVENLTIQAIKSPQKNFKNYAEHILTLQAKTKVKPDKTK